MIPILNFINVQYLFILFVETFPKENCMKKKEEEERDDTKLEFEVEDEVLLLDNPGICNLHSLKYRSLIA